MLIIREPHPLFMEIARNVELKKSKEYRCNNYVLSIPIDNGLLLWNTLSLALVFVENATSQDWHEMRLKTNRCIQELTKMWFYIPKEVKEKDIYHQILKIRSRDRANLKTKYTILTTMFCNARCFYCYNNHGQFVKASMLHTTAADIVNFICKERRGNDIQLDWIGGEPLLNPEVIDIICNGLKNNGINYCSNIITNGLLIDKVLDQRRILNWNLKSMQITLDGTETFYNKTKGCIDDIMNPFVHVLDNISIILDTTDIKLYIRLNLSSKNDYDIDVLIDQLRNQFPDIRRYVIYVCLLEEEIHDKNKQLLIVNQKNWYRITSKLWGIGFHLRNLENDWPFSKCIADNDNCHVISPLGRLYRCEEINHHDIVGDIYNGITNKDIVAKWKTTNKTNKCDSCPINPVCYNLMYCNSDRECNDLTRFMDIEARKFAMIKELEIFKNES